MIWEYHPKLHIFFITTMHHSPYCVLKPLRHHSSHASMWRKLQYSSVPMQLIYFTAKTTCHIIWKPPMHSHSKLFQHHPTSHIFGPGIHCVKFVVSFAIYDSLLAPLWMQDRSVSFLCDSSLPFLVYCCFFCFSQLFFS